jgi:hypothetical protein
VQDRRGKEGGAYIDTGCSVVERELAGEDHDDCGIGAERTEVLRVQRRECAEHAQAEVGRCEKTVGSEPLSI